MESADAMRCATELSSSNDLIKECAKLATDEAWDFTTAAMLFMSMPYTSSGTGAQMLAGMAVDAFLNHDFASSQAFYKVMLTRHGARPPDPENGRYRCAGVLCCQAHDRFRV